MSDAFWAAMAAMVASIASVLMSWRNSGKLSAVEVKMDGRLEELLKTTRAASRAEGGAEERALAAAAPVQAPVGQPLKVKVPEQDLVVEAAGAPKSGGVAKKGKP